MAGLNNLHGKKAAPFVKGGGRSKTHPRDAKGKLRKRALKTLRKAKGEPDADDLATGVSGHEIDLDWSAWNAAHKGQQRTNRAAKNGAPRSEIRNFKKSAGLKGAGLGPKAQAALQARAAAPGDHFRAKAILAAESGNKALAAKYTAQMVAKRAAELKARGSKAKPFDPTAPRRAPRQSPPAAARVVTHTPAPPVKSVPKPPPTRPKRVPAKYRTQAMNTKAHAAALRKDFSSLSREEMIDLAFRYRHGWIKIGSAADVDPAPTKRADTLMGTTRSVLTDAQKTAMDKRYSNRGMKAAQKASRSAKDTWQAGHDAGYNDAKAGKSPSVGPDAADMHSLGYQRGYAKFHEEQTHKATSEELTAAVKRRESARKVAKRIKRKENYTMNRLKLENSDSIIARLRKDQPVVGTWLSTPAGDDTDLSVLTAAQRKALPTSAFVFPKKRAYPIHDKVHAANALARSKGKPEHAAVVAAVRARYPKMGQ